MLGAIISGLASGAEAVAAWLRSKQQAKDQSDGATAQVASDDSAVLASAAASQSTAASTDQRTTDDLRAEALKTASGS